MNLNPELKNAFRDFNINPAHGIIYLLTVYHNIAVSGELEKLLDSTMKQINVSKIIEKDYHTGTVVWNFPLYEGEENEWKWVNDEYRPLFASVNKLRGGSLSSCVRKMKEFFKKHPAVRKQDVIEAVKLYLGTVDDPQYLQQADYFISKNADIKSSFSSRLEQFVELVKEGKKSSSGVNYKVMNK